LWGKGFVKPLSFKRHRFPPEVMRHAVWLYFRFNLSLRDVEDMLAERGIEVSYETICCLTKKFGPQFARRLKRQRPPLPCTGTSTRWSALSPASACTFGALSTTKARFSTLYAEPAGHRGCDEVAKAPAPQLACRSRTDHHRRVSFLSRHPTGARSPAPPPTRPAARKQPR
jgi:hypothetical protein